MKNLKDLKGYSLKYIFNITILSTIIFVSCEKNKSAISAQNPISEKFESWQGEELYFQFYKENNGDEVNILYKDTLYVAIINYKSSHDSISKKLFTENYPMRFLYFHKIRDNLNFSITNYTPNELTKKFEMDTIWPATNNEILFDFRFEKAGTFYLNGYIDDFVYLQNKNKISDSTKLRLLSKKVIISQKVEIFE